MPECLPEKKVIICSEIYPNDYKITAEEILHHAEKLDVNLLHEPHLLPIVLRGLLHPLPVGWIPCYYADLQTFFYYNVVNGTSQWEHPIDEYYRNLIAKTRCCKNLSDDLNLKNIFDFEMLPLRQNKKPQLLPIKQLLKYRDEEKNTDADDYIVSSNLFSSLKTKNDSNSNYKKSVSFSTNKLETFSENASPTLNRSDEISSTKNKGHNETQNSRQVRADYRKLYDRSLSNSDDDFKPDEALQNRSQRRKSNLEISPTTLKQPPERSKTSFIEKLPLKNFKRLQINLNHPDSFLISDSNLDDTIENIVSESVSSEVVSEEETPHNILTNITESGIDVNTVTDIQKLKAKNKMTNYSQNHNLNMQDVNTSLNEAISNLEQNLSTKFEMKIAEEIAKLKKHFSIPTLNLENQSNSEFILKETQKCLQTFSREIEKKVEKSYAMIDALKTVYDHEINDLKEVQKKYGDIVYHKFEEYEKKLEKDQKKINDCITQRLNDLEQSTTKKLENIEIKNETIMKKVESEKEKVLLKLHEKFQSFLEANQNNNEKLWRENHECIIQNKIYELFTNEMGDESVISQGIKKIVLNVHNERSLKENRMASEDPRTVSTQTETPSNLEEMMSMKKEIEEILTAISRLTAEMQNFKKYRRNDDYRMENADITFDSSRQKYLGTNRNRSLEGSSEKENTFFPLKSDAYKTDFSPFEELTSDIDKELDCYRKKYILSNSKWLLSK